MNPMIVAAAGWAASNAAYDAVVPQSIQKQIQSLIFEPTQKAATSVVTYIDVRRMG